MVAAYWNCFQFIARVRIVLSNYHCLPDSPLAAFSTRWEGNMVQFDNYNTVKSFDAANVHISMYIFMHM